MAFGERFSYLGANNYVIRPFQPGDILLIQRLHRQTTKLNAVQSLLQPRSPSWVALTAVNPWNAAKVATCVLRRHGQGLARSGFLQAQKRPGRPEADILALAPALDTPTGHPAVWEKLLSHYLHEVAAQGIQRVYVDAPDQPLPVRTFANVGFQVYQRQTVWRLVASDATSLVETPRAVIRPQQTRDEWGLLRLYSLVTPKTVQAAEGVLGEPTVDPPILHRWFSGELRSLVLLDDGEIAGCIQAAIGRMGIWLELWANTQRPDGLVPRQLLTHALRTLGRPDERRPVYVAVAEHHGGLTPLLTELGFAPFTDQAKMVRPVVQWAVETEPVRTASLEVAHEIAVTVHSIGHRTNAGKMMRRTTLRQGTHHMPGSYRVISH